jgi:hypothetical protein
MGGAGEAFLWGNVKERDRLGDLGVDVRLVLNWILKRTIKYVSTGFIDSG